MLHQPVRMSSRHQERLHQEPPVPLQPGHRIRYGSPTRVADKLTEKSDSIDGFRFPEQSERLQLDMNRLAYTWEQACKEKKQATHDNSLHKTNTALLGNVSSYKKHDSYLDDTAQGELVEIQCQQFLAQAFRKLELKSYSACFQKETHA